LLEYALTHERPPKHPVRHTHFRRTDGSVQIVGAAPCMEAVFQMMLRSSRSREPVLIIGETGTGKELVARAIHDMSSGREKPFLPIDCCTMVPSLIESELFGYVRGAFTGATSSRVGLFESAQGGTVFLDEIGEMPLYLQSKLLRAIQEKKVRPVGGTGWIDFNARIIAATNLDLETEMERGAFRKDLYFRLNVLSLILPPLRHRKEDIPALANHFLMKACEGRPEPVTLSAATLDCLMCYEWPGNVRELENCIRRAIAWASGPILEPADLPMYIRHQSPAHANGNGNHGALMPLQEIERQAILRALAAANGDKVLAARMLGIGKTTIYRKLKEYGAV